jgi:hypothetical protein
VASCQSTTPFLSSHNLHLAALDYQATKKHHDTTNETEDFKKRRVTTNTPIITQILQLRQDNQQKCHREVKTKNVTEYNSNNATLSVFVRKRPVRKEESGDGDAIQTLDFSDHGKVLVYQSKRRLDGLGEKVEMTPFSFDGVFGEQDTTREVYTRTVSNLIPELFVGRSVSGNFIDLDYFHSS